MKAYKLEVLVIDYEDLGEENAKNCIENEKYLNPSVMNIESVDIGEWSDDHLLNGCNTHEAEYKRLFKIDGWAK